MVEARAAASECAGAAVNAAASCRHASRRQAKSVRMAVAD